MKIAILGASGKAGQAILKEAVQRGLEVTAIVRDKNKISESIPVLERDVYGLTKEDVQNFDVLISALGFWQDVAQFTPSTQHLIEILQGQTTRLLVVGGAGSLYVDSDEQTQLKDTATFPKENFPLADAMSQALTLLKEAQDVHWTYLSPAKTFDAKGQRTGHYEVAGEVLTSNAKGESYISYADYAVAMIDEVEQPQHENQRFSVYQG